jgi:steroid delta-isomerase-like uncharacterized protein
MTSEENKAIVRHFIEEAMGRGRMSAVDECLAPDFVDHNAPAGLPTDRNSPKIQFTNLRTAFPDLEVIIHDEFAEGDKVVVCKTLRGTHRGHFMGVAPTGKTIAFETINILRLVDGKIVEHWNMIDHPTLMRQLKESPRMTPAENKAIVRTFVEQAQSQGRLSAIDEYLAADFVDHNAPAGLPTDREGVRMQFTGLLTAFPDLKAIIHDQIAEGEKVVTRKSLRGTHRGDFLGIAPTGKAVSLEVIDILRLVDGKIVEHWNVVDLLGLMVQLGVMPAAVEA